MSINPVLPARPLDACSWLRPPVLGLLTLYARLPLWLRWLSLFGLGSLMGLIQEPVGAWWLLFFTLPMLALALDGLNLSKRSYKAQGFWLGHGFGMGYFLTNSAWIRYSFAFFPDIPQGSGWFAMIALAGFLGCFWGGASFLTYKFWPNDRLRHIILAAFLALFDFARTLGPFGGFALNLPAYTLLINPFMEQGLSLIGPYGLNLVVFLCGFTPIVFFSRFSRINLVWLIASPLIVVSLSAFGAWRLDKAAVMNTNIALKLIQPNISQGDKMNHNRVFDNVRVYDNLASQTPWQDNNAAAKVTIYPETALHFVYESFPELPFTPMPNLNGSDVLLSGSFRIEKKEGENQPSSSRYYNAMYAFLPDVKANAPLQFVHLYDKVKLVPFGEYIPGAELLNSLNVPYAEILLGLSAGETIEVQSLEPIPPFLPLICFDALFPMFLNSPAATSAEWLLVLTNDGWFLGSDGPSQHFAQTRARAIELGLPLVRSTPSGRSAIIDPFGRVIADLAKSERGVVQALLPEPLPPTLYRKFGETLWLGLVLIIMGYGIVSYRQSQKYIMRPLKNDHSFK